MREMKDSGVEWLGEVPAEWNFDRFGSFFALRNERVSDEEYIPLSVTMGGVVPQLSHVAKSDDHANRKLVCKGDFVINSRSDRRNSCGFASQDGSVSLINTICVPRGEIESRYFGYLFDSSQWSDVFYSWGHGIVADLWTTGWNDMKKILLPVPPLDEQRRIADYLDEKCAEVDRAVSAAEQSIEEYKLLLSAVIDERFSRYGRRVKLSRISSLITDGDHQAPPRSDEGIPFLVISNISKGKIDFSNTDYVSEKYYDSLPISRRAQKGDVLVSVTGSYGIPVVVDVERPFCFQRHIALVRPSVDPDYIRFAMKTSEFSHYCDGVVTGAAQKTLTLGSLRSAPIIDVPSAEVDVLVRNLLAKEAEIDAAIAAKRAIIADLKAYKQSLIYETVTGKREV